MTTPMITLSRTMSDILTAGLIALILAAMHLRAEDIFMVVAFAGLVMLLASNRGRVARVLSLAPLLWLGQISYSIYMSHFLVLRAVQFVSMAASGTRIGTNLGVWSSLAVLGLLVAVVLALSSCLHRCVEGPAREAVRSGLASFRWPMALRAVAPRRAEPDATGTGGDDIPGGRRPA